VIRIGSVWRELSGCLEIDMEWKVESNYDVGYRVALPNSVEENLSYRYDFGNSGAVELTVMIEI